VCEREEGEVGVSFPLHMNMGVQRVCRWHLIGVLPMGPDGELRDRGPRRVTAQVGFFICDMELKGKKKKE